MAVARVNGVELNYEVHGNAGPWLALTPGGRLGLTEVRSLAQRVSQAGYRVLIHDRRNCGASEFSIAGEGAEHQIWAGDLHALLEQLDALPAYVGGGSSGCRMSLDFALRYRSVTRGLLLWRVTGGAFAVARLREKYYGEYLRAVRSGGMQAVCETAHFKEVIAARPANRALILATDPQRFIDTMERWDRLFQVGSDEAVIGVSAAQLQSLTIPACVVPGNDKTHPRRAAEELARLLPRAELNNLMGEDIDIDVDPPEHWIARDGDLAAILTRRLVTASSA